MLKKSPDALVIVSIVLVFFTVLTWVIPSGEFLREVSDGRTVLVPGTYDAVDAEPQGLGDLLLAPIRGLVAAADIIGFVLIVGGAFAILAATGALDAGLGSVLKLAETRPRLRHFIVPILMVLFSLAGATFGMAEENLVFILITLPLARSMGYDNLVGIAIPFLGSAAGFAGAPINPFTVGIAQGIAELPIGSGAGYRWFVWAVFTLIAIVFVMRYIRKLESGKARGFTAEYATDATPETTAIKKFTTAHKFILVLFLIAIVMLMYGANNLGWYIHEISGLFLALGLLSAVIARMGAAKTVKSFTDGAKDMLTAALIIGLSRSALLIAEEGKIIDTILHAMSGAVEDFPQALSLQFMFVAQAFINVFIPSGSGQAAITMPIMAPLSDLLGISRQTAVLAFQFGDGLLNPIIPTSGVTMGILSISKIPYNVWVRWVGKLILVYTATSVVLLALTEFFDVWP